MDCVKGKDDHCSNIEEETAAPSFFLSALMFAFPSFFFFFWLVRILTSENIFCFKLLHLGQGNDCNWTKWLKGPTNCSVVQECHSCSERDCYAEGGKFHFIHNLERIKSREVLGLCFQLVFGIRGMARTLIRR